MKSKRAVTRRTAKTRRPVARRRPTRVKVSADALTTTQPAKARVKRRLSTAKATPLPRVIRKRVIRKTVPLVPQEIFPSEFTLAATEPKAQAGSTQSTVTSPVPLAEPSPKKTPPPAEKFPPCTHPEPAVVPAVGRESDHERASQSATTTSPAPDPSTPSSLADVVSSKLGLSVPSILLEGDEPVRPQVSGPGRKFELGVAAPGDAKAKSEEDLPEAYGTGRLWLVARDPHCLYANWDLSARQQREFNTESVHQHLLVRVYRDHPAGRPLNEIHVHPESRHWFLHVEHGAAKYIAELGFYSRNGHWQRVALSDAVQTPADTPTLGGVTQFATMIFEPGLIAHSEQPRQGATPGGVARAQSEVPSPLGANVNTTTEFQQPVPSPGSLAYDQWAANFGSTVAPLTQVWTAAQAEMIAEMSGWTAPQTRWLDSLEVTELVRGVTVREIPVPQPPPGELAPSSIELGISSPGPELQAEVSSPFGGELPAQPQFWFNVNAELVIYGATEPDALVTIGNRPIRLRPDGTFSYRFALPDGAYDLPIVATASHGDSRQAHLRFHRGTSYSGEVGVHPHDPALRTPDPRHVA